MNGMRDDGKAARVVDRVDRVLNRHVHAYLPIQEQTDDVDAGRE